MVERVLEDRDWRRLMDRAVEEVRRLMEEGLDPVEVRAARDRLTIVAAPRRATCPSCSTASLEVALVSARWVEVRCRRCGHVRYYDLWEMARAAPTLP